MTLADTKYFYWLYSKIRPGNGDYRRLAKKLHSIPYRWWVPNDDNREGDGIFLRERYFDEKMLDSSPEDFIPPASVFEVIVALAGRMEDQLYDPEYGDRTSQWFWEMMRNLRLDHFSDERWVKGPTDRKVDEIVEIFLARKYDSQGNGGLFPLVQKPKKNQKNVEIWYQMMTYLLEKYNF